MPVNLPIHILSLANIAAETLRNLGFKITAVDLDPLTARFHGKGYREISVTFTATSAVVYWTPLKGETTRFESVKGSAEDRVHDAILKLFQFWTNPPIKTADHLNAEHRCVLVWYRPANAKGSFRVVFCSDRDEPLIFGNYSNIQDAKIQVERKGFRPSAWKRPDDSTYHSL